MGFFFFFGTDSVHSDGTKVFREGSSKQYYSHLKNMRLDTTCSWSEVYVKQLADLGSSLNGLVLPCLFRCVCVCVYCFNVCG